MGASDWINLIQGAVLLFFAWQQNRIFERQNRIFATQEGQAVPSESVRRFSIRQYWPTLVMILLVLVPAYDIYDRHSQKEFDEPFVNAANLNENSEKDYEQIHNRHFVNGTVELDGKAFHDCTFDNVHMIFHGRKTFALSHNIFHGTVVISTDNARLSAFGEMLGVMGLIGGGTNARWREQEQTADFEAIMIFPNESRPIGPQK